MLLLVCLYLIMNHECKCDVQKPKKATEISLAKATVDRSHKDLLLAAISLLEDIRYQGFQKPNKFV